MLINRHGRTLGAAGLLMASATAAFGGVTIAPNAAASLNVEAILMFFLVVSGTLFITRWAASRTKTTADFYAAGGNLRTVGH